MMSITEWGKPAEGWKPQYLSPYVDIREVSKEVYHRKIWPVKRELLKAKERRVDYQRLFYRNRSLDRKIKEIMDRLDKLEARDK